MDRTVNLTIATFNRIDCTRQCIESIISRTRHPHRLTIIDNGSTDGTQDYLRGLHAAGVLADLVLLDANMGISPAYNLGWEICDAAYYMKIDNDVVFLRDDWLETLVGYADTNPDVAMIGFGKSFREIVHSRDANNVLHHVGHVGGCVLIRRDVHEKIGFWNEDYGLYGEEDSDFGLRARLAGYVNVVVHNPDVPFIRYSDAEFEQHAEYQSWKAGKRRKNLDAWCTFNDCLFKCGFRPTYVGRKFIPHVQGTSCTFTANKEYLREIAALEAKYQPHLDRILASEEFARINDELGFNFWY